MTEGAWLAPEETGLGALRRLERLFAQAGLPEHAADATVLVEEATGRRRAALLLGAAHPLGGEAAARLSGWAARRLGGEPVFRIIGQREFWGLALRVTPDVLDPRPDTETLVAAVLRRLAKRRGHRLRVLDLGTGSGALLCALLSELPHARGIGVDLSPGACAVAAANLRACGLESRADIRHGDWTAPVDGVFDLVVSNPPYILSGDLPDLPVEVREHDPALALDGGPDGLDAYRRIVPRLPGLMTAGGVVAFETGWTQGPAVARMLDGAGFSAIGIERDLGGRERVVLGLCEEGAAP